MFKIFVLIISYVQTEHQHTLLVQAYKDIDEKVSDSAMKVIKRHTWYLHGEFLPVCLWDPELSDEVKSDVATKISEQPSDADDPMERTFVGRHGTDYGKPDLLAVNTNVESLVQLVTPASWIFFRILGINPDFLAVSPTEWSSDENWKRGEAIVRNMKVTNESAERGVKLASDYLKLAKNENNFQNYLQVVEQERRDHPNLRKITKKM